jgi:diguanylate cyclase (GGDEF)-like protein/PAS domain S-box-containing protein
MSILSTVALALALSVLAGILSTLYLRQEIGRVFEVRAHRLAERLDREIYGRWREIELMAQAQTFIRADITVEQRRDLLEAMRATTPAFAWIGFIDADGRVLVSTDGLLEGADVSTRPWFVNGSQAPYVGDLHEAVMLKKLLPNPSDEPPYFLDVAAPVYKDGEVIGVLSAHLSWAWLASMMQTINHEDGNIDPSSRTEIFIISSDGYVLMDNQSSPPTMPPYPFSLPELLLEKTVNSGSSTTRWDDGKIYIVGQAVSNGHSSFQGFGYTFLLRQNESDALIPARGLQLALILTGLALAGAFSMLITFIIRGLIQPLKDIVDAVHQIRSGDNTTIIPISTPHDEVGILGQALRDAFAALNRRNTELSALNETLERRIEERTNIVEHRARELSNEIATRKHLEQALTESRESFRRLVDTGLDGIAISIDGVIIYSNKALVNLFGYEQFELVRMSENEFVAPESRHIVEDIFTLGDQRLHEVVGIHKNGTRFPMEVSGRSLKYSGAHARVITVRDISSRKRTEAEIQTLYTLSQKRLEDVKKLNETLEYRSNHDHLTHLANRQALEHHLQSVLNEAPLRGRGVAVIFIDLDHFKETNDMLGHSAGDLLLQMVASRMRDNTEDIGQLARMGGDEFALVVPMIQTRAEAFEIAQTILQAISAEPYNLRGRDVKITASIGISFYPEHGHTVENLLRKADIALYNAKDGGRNTYRQADDSTEIDLLAQMQLEIDLREALNRGQLEVHYQPQFTLHDDKIVGFEALLRWHHPTLGNIPPARFIPVAEATDLILSIGAWVLKQAAMQAKAWRAMGYPVNVSVNVSPRQFESPDFIVTVKEALVASGIPPSSLELEVTENLLIRDIESKATILEELADHGVRIAIDDFGTGFSSLSYLQKLPINTLKIDRSFIAGIREDDHSARSTATAIIRAVSQMAHSLGLMVVAEGVETELQISVLRLLEADALQGYLLGRPMPAANAQALLERSTIQSER